MLRNRNNSVDLSTQGTLDNSESSKASGFRLFLFYSVLTLATMRCLLHNFKRTLVGDGPITDVVIDLMDTVRIDLNNYIPLLGNR